MYFGLLYGNQLACREGAIPRGVVGMRVRVRRREILVLVRLLSSFVCTYVCTEEYVCTNKKGGRGGKGVCNKVRSVCTMYYVYVVLRFPVTSRKDWVRWVRWGKRWGQG